MTVKDFILQQLEGIYPKKVSDKQIAICCPFHYETKPSLYISLVHDQVIPGSYNCFGCGASGWWNDIAKVLKLQVIDKETEDIELEDEFSILKSKLSALEKNSREFTLPANLYEWDLGSWRTFSASFLAQFQPAKIFDEKNKEWRILFPITHFGKLMGYLSERVGKRGPKHIFSKKFPSSKILYPVDLHKGSTVILVEGLTDMLRLRKEGLPALCFFGTGNWKSNKMNILMSLGIEKVIVCCDGDNPGWKCNRVIYKDLRDYFETVMFDIPPRSIELTKYNRKQLIEYIQRHRLLIKNIEEITNKELFNRIANIIDKEGWDPDNMPKRFIYQLYKLVA